MLPSAYSNAQDLTRLAFDLNILRSNRISLSLWQMMLMNIDLHHMEDFPGISHRISDFWAITYISHQVLRKQYYIPFSEYPVLLAI